MASPILWRRPSILGSGDPTQLHVTYGADPATQMTVSWATDAAVVHPSLTLGTPAGGPGSTFAAQTRTYTAAATATMAATEVTTQHVQLSGLLPGTTLRLHGHPRRCQHGDRRHLHDPAARPLSLPVQQLR